MQKLEEKTLKKKMKELESPLNMQDVPCAHSRSACNTRLARKRPMKHTLSAKAYAKLEVRVKIKLPSAYIRRRKQKKKTQSHNPHTGISLRGNPLFSHSPFSCY